MSSKLKTFIVKVQLSLDSSDGVQHCLIYNRDRSVQWTGPAVDSLKVAMDGHPKKYYYAHLEGTLIKLDREAGAQNW